MTLDLTKDLCLDNADRTPVTLLVSDGLGRYPVIVRVDEEGVTWIRKFNLEGDPPAGYGRRLINVRRKWKVEV